MAEPALRFGKAFKVIAIEGRFHGSAVRVAAENGVASRGGLEQHTRWWAVTPSTSSEVDGDDVAGIAGDEEIAGTGAENQVGDDA